MREASDLTELEQQIPLSLEKKGKWKAYPNFSESHLSDDATKSYRTEWLEKIPAHWEVVCSKRLFTERKEKANPDDEMLTASQKYGMISQKEYIRLQGHQVVQVQKGHDILKHVEPNDFVMSMRTFQGGLELSSTQGAVSSAYVPLTPTEEVYPGYFKYLFKSRPYISALQQTTNLVRDGQALRYNNFLQIRLPVIPLPEQQTIAAFLDHYTAKIDTLIEKKKKLIELLKEKRMALISHAVTKGLDPNAPMNDSGVEWLGEIPEGWEVMPVLTVFREQKEKNTGLKQQNVLSLSYGRIITRDVEKGLGLLPESFETYQVVHPGDIVLRLTDLQNDKKSLRTGLVRELGIITSAYLTLRPRRLHPQFAAFLLHAYDVNKVFYAMGDGVRQTMRFEDLKWMRVVVPSESEQSSIVEFLDTKCRRTDRVLEELGVSVDRLAEYRTALISAAVTGKIDVRDWSPPK